MADNIETLSNPAIHNLMDKAGSFYRVVGEGVDSLINSRKSRAVAMLGAGVVGMTSNQDTAQAGLVPMESQVDGLYTTAAPTHSLRGIEASLLPDSGMVLKAAKLTPDTLQAEGDCAKGSGYKFWLDTPQEIRTERCDGTVETAPNPQADYIPGRFQPVLNLLGAQQVNSIHGFSVDLKQNTKTLEVNESSVAAELECPPADTKLPLVKSIAGNALQGASVTFCPSKKAVTVSRPNEKDATYQTALSKFKEDNARNSQWGGDYLKYNTYLICPDVPKRQRPIMKPTYRKSREDIKIRVAAGNYTKYCDKVGQFTEVITAQFSKNRKSKPKKVGRNVVRINGLRQTLAFGYDMNWKQKFDRVVVPEAGDICSGRSSKSTLRIKMVQRFTAFKGQTFQNAFEGPNNMRSATKTYFSKRFKICR